MNGATEVIKALKKLNKRYTCAELARKIGVPYLAVYRWLYYGVEPRSNIVIKRIEMVIKELK